MPDHSTHFEASGGGLVLANAILLYRHEAPRNRQFYAERRDDAAAFASFHRIEQDGEGVPTIAAGVPLTRSHLRQWTDALGRTAIPEILPETVLVAHPDLLAWWVPAQVRTAYFALSDPPSDLRALSGRTNVAVPYPAHLFVATGSGLGVYALPTNRRPVADTPVLYSPILNVYTDGALCWGSIARPRGLSIAAIPDFERAVFDSWSTHPNPGQELTVTGKGGLVRLWDELAARGADRFPVRRLKPFVATGRRRAMGSASVAAVGKMTVGKIIAASARR